MNSYEPNTNNISRLEKMMEDNNVTNVQGWWGVHPATDETDEDEPICIHCKLLEQDNEINDLHTKLAKLQGEVEFLMVQACSK